MTMRYFKNNETSEIFGYDQDQEHLSELALENGLEEITGNWPPSPEVEQEVPPPAPTKEDLLAQLEALQAQILALGA